MSKIQPEDRYLEQLFSSVDDQVDQLVDKYPGWSPYNYCLNNPLKFNDPIGKWAIEQTQGKYFLTVMSTFTMNLYQFNLFCKKIISVMNFNIDVTSEANKFILNTTGDDIFSRGIDQGSALYDNTIDRIDVAGPLVDQETIAFNHKVDELWINSHMPSKITDIEGIKVFDDQILR